MTTAYTASTAFTGTATATFAGTSPLTASAPTDPLDGAPTSSINKLSIYASVASTVTFSGAGSLLAYVYTPLLGRWARSPGQDLSIATSGTRDLCLGVALIARFKNAQNTGERIAYVPSGVTFSAGSAGVTLLLEGENVSNASVGA